MLPDEGRALSLRGSVESRGKGLLPDREIPVSRLGFRDIPDSGKMFAHSLRVLTPPPFLWCSAPYRRTVFL